MTTQRKKGHQLQKKQKEEALSRTIASDESDDSVREEEWN